MCLDLSDECHMCSDVAESAAPSPQQTERRYRRSAGYRLDKTTSE